MAEGKYRYEHFIRLKANIEDSLAQGKCAPPRWQALAPGSWVFLAAAEEDEKYWDENVRHPAMSWLSQGAKGPLKAREEEVADVAISGGASALRPDAEVPAGAVGQDRKPWGQGISEKAAARRVRREAGRQPAAPYTEGRGKTKNAKGGKGSGSGGKSGGGADGTKVSCNSATRIP